MTGYNILAVIIFMASVAFALEPSAVSGDGATSSTTEVAPQENNIPPIVPPGRGSFNESNTIIINDTVTAPQPSGQVPVQSATDMELSTRVQWELNKSFSEYNFTGRTIYSQGGVVTLQGPVRNLSDAVKIENTVKRMPGVKSVRSYLTIEEPGNTR